MMRNDESSGASAQPVSRSAVHGPGWRVALACALAALAAGCQHTGSEVLGRGPFFTPANVSADPNLGGIRRVVLLPLWAPDATPAESAVALDEVLVAALQQQNRFEVVALSRAECARRFSAAAFSSAGALPHDFLAHLRRDFAADAVLFVDLTVHQAYRPLALGFRAKLATLDIARLVWTFDNVYSAGDPAVANSVKRHAKERYRDMPTDATAGVLQSPSRFAAYAAESMFATLPPVNTLVPIPPR